MSVTYTAVLPVSEHTVLFVSALLYAQRRRLGTRAGTRSLGCYRQAILILRWLLDGTRITQLAIDNQVSKSTGYAYLHEGLTVIADQDMTFIDAAGIRSLLKCRSDASETGTCLLITNPAPAVDWILRITGLWEAFGLPPQMSPEVREGVAGHPPVWRGQAPGEAHPR